LKLPRDLSGEKLARLLHRFGYEITRQTGSHMRLTSAIKNFEHHLTIPAHKQVVSERWRKSSRMRLRISKSQKNNSRKISSGRQLLVPNGSLYAIFGSLGTEEGGSAS
jgi:predicted RNA binding protein YcfA (HicA-like mRNA interferase family)